MCGTSLKFPKMYVWQIYDEWSGRDRKVLISDKEDAEIAGQGNQPRLTKNGKHELGVIPESNGAGKIHDQRVSNGNDSSVLNIGLEGISASAG